MRFSAAFVAVFALATVACTSSRRAQGVCAGGESCASGICKLSWPNDGDGVSIKYEGQCEDHRPEGVGRMWTTEPKKKTYTEGLYHEGWLDGRGKSEITYANGKVERYEGTYKAGKRHGAGVLEYANGKKYVGDFVTGAPEGKGTLYRRDGTVEHDGAFKDGKPVK